MIRPPTPLTSCIPIQGSRRIPLELHQRPLGLDARPQDDMNMIRPDMSSVEDPLPDLAVAKYRVEHQPSLIGIQSDRRILEQAPLEALSPAIRRQHRRTGHIGKAVNAAPRIAVQACSVAGKGQEVRRRSIDEPSGRFRMWQLLRRSLASDPSLAFRARIGLSRSSSEQNDSMTALEVAGRKPRVPRGPPETLEPEQTS